MNQPSQTPRALPYEAKRVDATHAVIYDASGMLVLKTSGCEDAWEIASSVATACNEAAELREAARAVMDCPEFAAIASEGSMAPCEDALGKLAAALAKAAS